MNNHRVRTSSGVTQLFMRRTKTVVMSLQTIKEGHLYKRGKINTEWRMRTFVLNGKQLAYFKGGKHSPSGIIELKDVRRVTDLNGDGVFRVETPFRTYDIKGETIEEAQGWIKAVREALTVLESQP
ncbi:Pleckstrin homology domain-containing family A member 1 [Geodia barretti]|uniref:Pleckstrin homology domain-containing family A member 1 n=1 Tax=Geodia barretti TaxID=519541 RepID=A0AA35W4F6_GEOBA|nr:Pleckstrin homology domain-containing family A member 1 [Geodia barretti]